MALLQQLRGVESERSFLRDCERFFSHLFPGIVGFHPSSFHRRVRKLRRFLEPLRRALLEELAGDPETLFVDSTLLPVLHPRQVKQSAAGFEGAAWGRWGSFCVYGVKLHLVCSTNRVPISYESGALGRRLAESGILLSTGGASCRPATRQQIEVCFAHLKGAFGLGETLAKTLVGLAIRIAAKVTAYTCGLYVNRLLGRPQGRMKELWA